MPDQLTTTRPTVIRPRLAAVALLIALVAAACGSSNDSTTDTAGAADSSATTEQSDGGSADNSTETGSDDGAAAATTQAPTAAGGTTDAAAPVVTAAGNATATTVAITETTTTVAGTTETTTTVAATETTTTMTATTTTAAATTTTVAGPPVAPFDNDAQSNPVDWGLMNPTNKRTNTRTDEVSYPNGDNEDWVQFDIPNPTNTNYRLKSVELTCTLHGDVTNSQLQAKVWQEGKALTGAQTLAICGSGPVKPTVNGTQPIQIRVYFGLFSQDVHADYTLTVVYS